MGADTKNCEDDIVARRSMRGNKKEKKKEDTMPMRKPGPKRKASLKEKSKNATAVEEKSKPESVKRIKLTKDKESKVSSEQDDKQITKKGQKETTIEEDFNDLFKCLAKKKKVSLNDSIIIEKEKHARKEILIDMEKSKAKETITLDDTNDCSASRSNDTGNNSRPTLDSLIDKYNDF